MPLALTHAATNLALLAQVGLTGTPAIAALVKNVAILGLALAVQALDNDYG